MLQTQCLRCKRFPAFAEPEFVEDGIRRHVEENCGAPAKEGEVVSFRCTHCEAVLLAAKSDVPLMVQKHYTAGCPAKPATGGMSLNDFTATLDTADRAARGRKGHN